MCFLGWRTISWTDERADCTGSQLASLMRVNGERVLPGPHVGHHRERERAGAHLNSDQQGSPWRMKGSLLKVWARCHRKTRGWENDTRNLHREKSQQKCCGRRQEKGPQSVSHNDRADPERSHMFIHSANMHWAPTPCQTSSRPSSVCQWTVETACFKETVGERRQTIINDIMNI